jgi:hypothetical protein
VADNSISLDDTVKDAWGLPAMRVTYRDHPDDLKTAKNFVDAALSEVAQGKPVSVTTSRPYGCTIKYTS